MCLRTIVFAVLSLMFCLAAQAQFAAAATYYVAPDGNDSNPGTEAKPWKTPQKASQSVQPGDTVLFAPGLYSIGETWQVRCAGTADKPITFKGCGKDKAEVRINASTVLPSGGWKPHKGAIYQIEMGEKAMSVFQNGVPLAHDTKSNEINSVDDMHVNSFYKKGSTLYVWLADGSDPNKSEMRVADSHVVSLHAANYTVFEGLTLEFGFVGFKEQKDTHHVTIRNCILRSLSSQGIQPIPANCLIEGNLFQKIGATKFQHGMYGSRPGIIVRNNIFEEISGAAIHQYGGGKKEGDGWEISGNIFRKPRQYASKKGFGNYTDLILWALDGNKVFNNEFHGEGKRKVASLQSSNNRIYSNKFIGCPSPVSGGKGGGNEIRDNVVQ